jgi:hypothetical protein
MNGDRLPYLLPWVKVNLLIRSITQRTWPEDQWRVIKPQLRLRWRFVFSWDAKAGGTENAADEVGA